MDGRSRAAWKTATRIVWSERRRLAFGLALVMVDRVAGLALPLAPKLLLDEVVAARRPELLPLLAALVVASALLQALASYGLAHVLGLAAERVVVRWRRRVLAHLVRLPVARVDASTTGGLASRVMDDTAAVQELVGWEMVRWTSQALTAAAAFAALVWIDWRITLVALAVAAVPGLAIDVVHGRSRHVLREHAEAREALAGRVVQTLGGVRVVKAYAAERREDLLFARALHRMFRLLRRTTARTSAMRGVAALVYAAVVAVVLVLGGRAILEGRMTVGDFASYVAFALVFAAPLVDLPEVGRRLSETMTKLERVAELEAMRPEDDGDDARAPLADVKGDVAFERVGFAYGDGPPVLHEVSFSAPAGTTTAVVGPSGAGKSTLLALLLAFQRPGSGRVTVDGVDLAAVRLRDYRRRLGAVLQDEPLFDGTIADNIAYARPRATRDDIARAALLARCDVGPDGLDTKVGDRGVKLSGGQRQRVAIARAILADPRILVLDEATSSLDTENELLVRAALTELRRGRTTFVIAHRLSTVRDADQILVLEGGRIVERGKHDELLARSGRYRALCEAQLGLARPDDSEVRAKRPDQVPSSTTQSA